MSVEAELRRQLAHAIKDRDDFKAQLEERNHDINDPRYMSLVDRLRKDNFNMRVALEVERNHPGMSEGQREDLSERIWDNLKGIVANGGELLEGEVAEQITKVTADAPHLVPASKPRNLLTEARPDEFAVSESVIGGSRRKEDELREAAKLAGKRFLVVSDEDPSMTAFQKRGSALDRLRIANGETNNAA